MRISFSLKPIKTKLSVATATYFLIYTIPERNGHLTKPMESLKVQFPCYQQKNFFSISMYVQNHRTPLWDGNMHGCNLKYNNISN